MLISGVFLYLVGNGGIYSYRLNGICMQTPVLKDCKKEVMCSLSTRVYVSSTTQTHFFLCLGFFLSGVLC